MVRVKVEVGGDINDVSDREGVFNGHRYWFVWGDSVGSVSSQPHSTSSHKKALEGQCCGAHFG